MPAAAVTGPLSTPTASSSQPPAASGSGDAFGQVLRAVQDPTPAGAATVPTTSSSRAAGGSAPVGSAAPADPGMDADAGTAAAGRAAPVDPGADAGVEAAWPVAATARPVKTGGVAAAADRAAPADPRTDANANPVGAEPPAVAPARGSGGAEGVAAASPADASGAANAAGEPLPAVAPVADDGRATGNQPGATSPIVARKPAAPVQTAATSKPLHSRTVTAQPAAAGQPGGAVALAAVQPAQSFALITPLLPQATALSPDGAATGSAAVAPASAAPVPQPAPLPVGSALATPSVDGAPGAGERAAEAVLAGGSRAAKAGREVTADLSSDALTNGGTPVGSGAVPGHPASAPSLAGLPSAAGRSAAGAAAAAEPAVPTAIQGLLLGPAASGAGAASDHKLTLHATDDAAAPAPALAEVGPAPNVALPPALPASIPPEATVTATSRPQSPPAAALADQVAPALLTLSKSADGSRETTVQLQPAELGLVQIRLIRAASGATQVDITADKPATLLALQRDQPQLHLALDQAGIPAAGRSVTFHSVPPAAPAATGSGQTSGQSTASGGASGGGGQANADASGSKGHQLSREQNSYSSSRRTSGSTSAAAANVAAAAQTYRIGLDITA